MCVCACARALCSQPAPLKLLSWPALAAADHPSLSAGQRASAGQGCAAASLAGRPVALPMLKRQGTANAVATRLRASTSESNLDAQRRWSRALGQRLENGGTGRCATRASRTIELLVAPGPRLPESQPDWAARWARRARPCSPPADARTHRHSCAQFFCVSLLCRHHSRPEQIRGPRPAHNAGPPGEHALVAVPPHPKSNAEPRASVSSALAGSRPTDVRPPARLEPAARVGTGITH